MKPLVIHLAMALLAVGLSACPVEDPAPEPDLGWQEAFDASDQGAMMSVWGPGTNDVYVVGGQPGEGVAWHWDGENWSALDLPASGMLNWVHGADSETVWLVGEEGVTMVGNARDGFSIVDTPTEVPLWGVWALSEMDTWAVGGDARDADGAPVLLQWNGTDWQAVELPAIDRPAPALFKVWASGPSQVIAVGSAGLMLIFEGTEWRQQLVGTTEDLISLWGTSTDRIAVTGGRSNGVLTRWDGEAWESEILSGVAGLNGVWMADDGTVHLAGVFGTLIHVPPDAEEPVIESSQTDLTLHAIWGDGTGRRYSVGGSLMFSPPFRGVALEDD